MNDKPFIQKFDVRWSDIDANRHVANSAYVNFMSHTRMAYLVKHGFGMKEIAHYQISPVVFHEKISYFKEVFGNHPLYVSLQLKGASEDGMFFEFLHGIYSQDGTHHVSCSILGAFINMQNRKLSPLPPEVYEKLFANISRTEDFRVLTKEHTREAGVFPQNQTDWF